MDDRILDIIGENINTSRRIKATSPRIVKDSDAVKLTYMKLDGELSSLDITELYPDDPEQLRKTQIAHVAQAMRIKDMDYIAWLVLRQVEAGANIIDICIDEICVDADERNEWMRWIIPVVQEISDVTFAIDSSDPKTIVAGLEVYDHGKSRPAINSVNLEDGRQELVLIAKDHNALLFANACGRDDMPQNAEERVANLDQIMKMMDEAELPMSDRYLDPLVFPIGAGSDFANHYLDAVRAIRASYPEVHIFGGHSNISFGLPQRRVINSAFIIHSILAGCDTLMIDPIVNPLEDFVQFKLASDALFGIDEMAMRYITHMR